MSEHWDHWDHLEWIDLDLPELGALSSFSVLSRRFRRDHPVALVTRLQALQGFVVVALLAPLHAAFWSAARPELLYTAFARLQREGLRSDDRKPFLADVRRAGIKLDSPAIRLLDLYAQFHARPGQRVPGYGDDGIGRPEFCRLASTGCPESALPALQQHLQRELDELGPFAFFQIDESASLTMPLLPDRTSVAACVFNHWSPLRDFGPEWRAAWRDDILAQQRWAVSRLEAGGRLELAVEPIFLIRPTPIFVLRGEESPPHLREADDPRCRQIVSLRARLVRQLGWPVFFEGVRRAMAPGSDARRLLDGLGRLEPFDAVAELDAYLDKMQQRFPCLTANPFGG